MVTTLAWDLLYLAWHKPQNLRVMKQFLHLRIAPILLVLLVACGGPRTVSLKTMRPAEITLPSSVKTLLIVDRSVPKNKPVNIIESVLTGELPGEDKSGIQEFLAGLNQQLGYSARFQVKTAQEKLPGNSLTSAFPDALSWEQVEQLGNQYQADAIVALEIFDSDFIITRGNKSVTEKVGDTEVRRLRYYAQGVGNLTIGIRLYDIANRNIVDQQKVSDTHAWEAYGSSVQEAILQLISKRDATVYLGNAVGTDYAYKVAPMPIRITRSFRGKAKKSPELEQGTRYADVAQWQNAIDVWKSGLDRARSKEAGFLAYNIAIGYEVLGDFDSALTWAETSYTRYGNKDARSYVRLIKNRLRSERIAREQLELGYQPQE